MKQIDPSRKKLIVAATTLSIMLCIMAGALLSALLTPQRETNELLSVFSSRGGQTYGSFTPVVKDGMTGAAVADAVVIVPEADGQYVTGADGCTKAIRVPIVPDARFDGILQKPWGEATVLVYADGYLPYALFYLQIPPGETRSGPEILLFREEDAPSAQPFSIVEGPNRAWVEALIEQYQPK